MSNSKKICEQAENLIDKVKLINEKYEKVLNAGEGRFNIFSILRNDHDEVNLHSKFIYELINPLGSHNQGDIFLKIFLKQMNIELDGLEDVRVNREYKFIDILIRTNNRAIIIENKIWAGDQDMQLKRYRDEMINEGFTSKNNKNIDIIYLTINGVNPQEYSSDGVPKEIIKCISYSEDINEWLDDCIREAAKLPKLREALFQYQSLVLKITGNTKMNENITDIKNVIVEGNNLQLAENIGMALIEAKVDIQYEFWEKLKASLNKSLADCRGKLEILICKKEKLKKYYTGSRGGGIIFMDITLPGSFSGSEINYRIEITDTLYHGFYVRDGGNAKEEKFNELAGFVGGLRNKYNRSGPWVEWKWPTENMDFKIAGENKYNILSKSSEIEEFIDSLEKEITESIHIYCEKYAT